MSAAPTKSWTIVPFSAGPTQPLQHRIGTRSFYQPLHGTGKEADYVAPVRFQPIFIRVLLISKCILRLLPIFT
jgi:hypothetical protein